MYKKLTFARLLLGTSHQHQSTSFRISDNITDSTILHRHLDYLSLAISLRHSISAPACKVNMVSFNSIVVSGIAITSALPLVTGAVLPAAGDNESTMVRRFENKQETWEMYHEQNAQLAKDGHCRSKIDPTDRDILWPCRQFCPEGSTVTCFGRWPGTASTAFVNPEGARWTYGQCLCENPVADAIIDFTMQGLEGVGPVVCAVWLEALKMGLEVGTSLIPGAGPAVKAAKIIVKTAKFADKMGGKEWWTGFIEDTCMIDNWDFDISKAFDIFHDGDESQMERI